MSNNINSVVNGRIDEMNGRMNKQASGGADELNK